MNQSDHNRTTPRPSGLQPQQSLRPAEIPIDSDSTTATMSGEEFLYHLSRGSELLKENQVQAAKEELEFALGLQPMDLRGQGLLGVVYFRLGLYPRAISIYRQIIAALEHEIPPRVNLALCYLKTGQHQAARELLEEVVRREPEHPRAWAYLGLAFQFQRDFAKAGAAFERAGQHGMAGRVRAMARGGDSLPGEPSIPDVSWEVEEPSPPPAPASDQAQAPKPDDGGRPDASVATTRLALSSSNHRPIEQAVTPCATRPLLQNWLSQHLPALEIPWRVDNTQSLSIELSEPFAVRATGIVALSPAEIGRRELRIAYRPRTSDIEELLGGAQAPIIGLRGPGRLLARASQGTLEAFELAGETLTVRHNFLFGFSLALRYEFERTRLTAADTLDAVELSGHGLVVLNLPSSARAHECDSGGLLVRSSELVGWTSELEPEALDPAEAPGRARWFVRLRGEGQAVLL